MHLCDSLFSGYLGEDLWPSNSSDFALWGVLEQKVSAERRRSLESPKRFPDRGKERTRRQLSAAHRRVADEASKGPREGGS